MSKVTKELIQEYYSSMHLPPRHQRGCPKNYARTLLLPLLASGYSFEDIKQRIEQEQESLPCECKEEGLLTEW